MIEMWPSTSNTDAGCDSCLVVGPLNAGRTTMHRQIAVTVLFLAAPALCSSQNLGEAARKGQERREKNAQAGVKAVHVDEEQLRSGNGTGKGTYSGNTGVAATNPDDRPAEKSGTRAGATAAGSPSGM